jgi:broad specificity phosphatase PhoE
MPYLHIVRHAQPDFTGNYDSVTALGVQQSEWLGEHFARRGLRFARIVCGDLRRQVATAQGILSRLAAEVEPVIDPRLNEYDAGSVLRFYAGASDVDLRRTGDRRGYFLAVREALLAWSRHEGPVANSETWADFGRRTLGALESACQGLATDDQVLVVTSGGVIGRVVAESLGAGPEAAIQLNLQTRNTGVTELVKGRSASRLVAFNAVPHLERPDRAHAVTHS